MIKVVFEDDYLMVFDKPPGLVVTSSETQKEPSLEDILKTDFNSQVERSGIVHRLDKDTSGLIVVAKSLEIMEALQAQFKNREVHKEYLALVHGRVEEKGKVDAPIGRNPGNREKFMVFSRASDSELNIRPAITEYNPQKYLEMGEEVIKELYPEFSKIQLKKLYTTHYPEFTLVLCKPLTGRTHQIRVHLKYLGFPIVGDSKYGGRKVVRLDHRWCKRQFLHAAKLEFTHPQTGKRMEFESTLSEDLQESLSFLEELK